MLWSGEYLTELYDFDAGHDSSGTRLVAAAASGLLDDVKALLDLRPCEGILMLSGCFLTAELK